MIKRLRKTALVPDGVRGEGRGFARLLDDLTLAVQALRLAQVEMSRGLLPGSRPLHRKNPLKTEHQGAEHD